MRDAEIKALKIGSLVRLNSGGPMLTVTGWEDGSGAAITTTRNDINIFCAWFDDRGQRQKADFPASCLKYEGPT